MGTKLLRVELSNIRSHEHVVFTPALEGITSISGPIGSGKSSIVDGIAWALYGTKPEGVSKNSEIFRNGADFKKDKGYVLVTLEVDGRIMEIKRRIMSKSDNECDVWEYLTAKEAETLTPEENEEDHSGMTKNAAEERFDQSVPEYLIDLVEGAQTFVKKHRSGPSVSHATQYVKRRLNMDAKGFLAAILVQQKQVDSLVSSKNNKERARVIEDLTGISAITTALGEARTEGNALKKMAQFSDASEDALKEAEKTVTTLTSEQEKTKKKHVKASEKHAAAKEKHAAAKADYTNKNERYEKIEEIEQKRNKAEAKLEESEKNFAFQLEERNTKKKQLDRLPKSGNFVELETQMKNANQQVFNTDARLKKIAELETELESTTTTSREYVDNSKIKDIETCDARKDETLGKIAALENRVTEYKTASNELQGEISKISKAITILTEGDGACPTCLQHVSAVDVAVASLTSEQEKAAETIVQHKENAIAYTKKQRNLESHIEKFAELRAHLVTISEYETTAQQYLTEKTELEQTLEAARNEHKAVEKLFRAAQQSQEIREEYDRLKTRALETSNEIEKLRKFVEASATKMKELGAVSSDQLTAARKKFDTAATEYAEATEKLSELTTEYKVNAERINHSEHVVTEQKEKIKKHKEILELVEVSTYTTKTIEEFRENRIRHAVPTIETYASEFINRFTEGKFVGLKMNEKFETRVTLQDGTERPVGLLSGGEMSATAMALRLAISLLLSDEDSRSLIILDEVLVSQDANSAEIILSTIKEVCKGQVIIIAHNQAIDSIVDNTFSLGDVIEGE